MPYTISCKMGGSIFWRKITILYSYIFKISSWWKLCMVQQARPWDTRPSEIRTSQIRRFELGSKMFEVRWFCADYQGASKQILHGFYVHFTWILLNTVSLNEGFSMQKFQWKIQNYSAGPVQKSRCSLWNQKQWKSFK